MAVQALEYPRLGLVGFLCKTLPTMYTAYWIAMNLMIIIGAILCMYTDRMDLRSRPGHKGCLLVHDGYMDILSFLIGTHTLLVLVYM